MVAEVTGGEATHDLVVIGASAGGVTALEQLVGRLPADLPAAVVVVLHTRAAAESRLARILDRAGALVAAPAADGEGLHPGRLYVAPPDHHVLVEPGVLRLSGGPRENGHRPAIDPTLRTAADCYAGRLVGVLLTGGGDDGTAGLAHVKRRGGTVLVQDPAEAPFPSMPRSALARVAVDATLGAAALGEAVDGLVRGRVLPGPRPGPRPEPVTPSETVPAPLVCPDCGGVLQEQHEGGVPTFSCHIGHRYGERSLLEQQEKAVETSLLVATRALEERAALLRRLAADAEAMRPMSAQQFLERAEDADAHVRVLRATLADGAGERGWPDDQLEAAP